MIRRPLLVAAAFLVSALVIFAALGRITAMTLALEKSEASALQRATHEENIRIALWRMDASLAEVIAVENTRSAARFADAEEPSGLSPEALLANASSAAPELASLVRARFEIGPDGERGSAAAAGAPGWLAGMAVPMQPPPGVARGALAPQTPWVVLQNAAPVDVDSLNVADVDSGRQAAYTQEALNNQAFKRRQELGQQSSLLQPVDAPPGVDVESAFAAGWVSNQLVLHREVRRGDARLVQVTWLDWPELRRRLLTEVAAVVPAARLEPLGPEPDPGRTLALLPVRLLPGPMPETTPQDSTPVRLSLAAAWVAALLGLIGVGALLTSSVSLSQRRADFVSAVTHELRTPLTTLRLYSEMLSDGMVGEEARPAHLATLKREADRLGHLVENVLAFSRLERRGDSSRSADASRLEGISLPALVERVVPALAERAARADLSLRVAAPAEGSMAVLVDCLTVEQILLNLVDNACKYARNPALPELHLETAERGRHAILRVRDHGGGFAERDRKRLFRPFHRSAADAAGSEPGVGLGLALSRRLARAMGGDLRLVSSPSGASFELWLRRADDRA